MLEDKTKRFFPYFGEDEFTGLLEETGYKVLETGRRDTSVDNWLIFYVQKNEKS